MMISAILRHTTLLVWTLSLRMYEMNENQQWVTHSSWTHRVRSGTMVHSKSLAHSHFFVVHVIALATIFHMSPQDQCAVSPPDIFSVQLSSSGVTGNTESRPGDSIRSMGNIVFHDFWEWRRQTLESHWL